MTDTAPPTPSLARFRGPVGCRRTVDALTLRGPAVDCAADVLILTFVAPRGPDLPGSLAGAGVTPLGERRYRITCDSREWVVEAASVHLHRDIGSAFHRAVPPRPAPLTKRLFWRAVLALAGTGPGKRLLLSLRRR